MTFIRSCLLLLVALFYSANTQAQIFTSAGPSPINNNGAVTSYNIVVSGMTNDTLRPTFGLEWVSLEIKHAKLSELAIYLKAPNGLMTALSVYEGGNDTLFQTIFFKNNATKKISQGSSPYHDTFLSTHSLAVFNRHNVLPNGTWQIMIYDMNPGKNGGTILQASIYFSNQPAQPYVYSTTNLPILSIHTDGIVIPTDPKIKVAYYAIDNPNKINKLSDTSNMVRKNMLIEIRGNSSSGGSSPKKGFLIRTIKPDLSDTNIALFGLPKEHDFILNNFFGDVTFTKDVMSYDLYRKLGRWSPRTKYIELFINNDYRGIYCVFEKIKRDKNRVDIATLKKTDTAGIEVTGGYIFKNDWTDVGDVTFNTPLTGKNYVMHQPDSPHATQLSYISNFMRKIDTTLVLYKNFSDTNNGYRKYVDHRSFIDYILMQEMSLSGDSYIGSTYFFKDKDTPGYVSKVNYGPPWDFNYSWGRSFGYSKRLRITTISPWKEMFQDTFFVKELWCRWNELRGSIYSMRSFESYFDSLPNMLQNQIYRDYERWPLGTNSPTQFYGNITNGFHYKTESNYIKNYLKVRLPELDSIFLKLCVNANIKNYCAPNVNVTFNKNGYCKGDSAIVLIAGTIKNYIVNINNQYIFNSPSEIRYKIVDNIPIQIVTNINGNFSTFYFSPKMDPLPTFPNNLPTEFCTGDTALLVIGKKDQYEFKPVSLLTKPITNDSIFFKPVSNFTATLIGTNPSGCKDSILLTCNMHTKPILAFQGNKPYCSGDSIVLRFNKVNNVNWISKSSSSKLINDTTLLVYNKHSYNYQVQPMNDGCLGSVQDISIQVNPLPVLKINPEYPQLIKGNNLELRISGAKTYRWLPSEYLSNDTGYITFANPPVTSTFTVVGTDSNNCVDSIQFSIQVNKQSNVPSLVLVPMQIQIEQSHLHISLKQPCKRIELFDGTGKMIQDIESNNKSSLNIDLTAVAKGIYYIKGYFNQGPFTYSFRLE